MGLESVFLRMLANSLIIKGFSEAYYEGLKVVVYRAKKLNLESCQYAEFLYKSCNLIENF